METIPKTPTERLDALVALVRDMRNAQVDYFERRNPRSLADAKRLERQVDLRVALYYAPELQFRDPKAAKCANCGFPSGLTG